MASVPDVEVGGDVARRLQLLEVRVELLQLLPAEAVAEEDDLVRRERLVRLVLLQQRLDVLRAEVGVDEVEVVSAQVRLIPGEIDLLRLPRKPVAVVVQPRRQLNKLFLVILIYIKFELKFLNKK